MVRWEDRPRFVDAQYERALSAEQEAFRFALEKTFYVFPHNWQTRAIVSLREKHDVMIRAGTGSGKSLICQAMGGHQPWGDRISYCTYYSSDGGSSIHFVREKLIKQVDILTDLRIRSCAMTAAKLMQWNHPYSKTCQSTPLASDCSPGI
jgi:hypothetical protein